MAASPLIADVFYLPHEAGVELARADQIEKGRGWIDAETIVLARNFFSRFQARRRRRGPFRPEILSTTASVRMITPAFSAAARDCSRNDRAHAALRQDLRARHAADLAGEAVVESEQRGRRARSEMAAEHRVEGEQTLQPVVGKLFVEKVGDIHQQHAQEIAHVFLAEPLQRQRRSGRAPTVSESDMPPRSGGRRASSGFKMPA